MSATAGATAARRARGRSAPVADVVPTPSYLAAAIAAAAVLALYVATLAPGTAMWDTSEYVVAAYVLGIPHPPGNPFFVLLGHVFTQLPIAPTVAQRVNLLAALCSALSAGAWFLVAERVLAGWLAARWQRIVGASLAAVLSATAFTVWNQSVVNEKVYTVSLLFFAVVSWLTVRWCDEPDGPAADRLLVLVAYLLGLGYSNHPAGFLVGPAVGVAVLARRWTTILRWRLVLACAGALALGLTPFAVEPIRAAHFPAINEGEPTACTEGIALSCTFDGVTARRLMANVNREQYGEHSVLERQAPLSAQLGMWWLYFRWQWLRDAHGERPGTQLALALLFLALGVLGGRAHYVHDRRSFWFFGPLVLSVTLALVYYMNFKYGYSQAPELADAVPREVRDRDYFYIWSYSTWGVWAALGVVSLWAAAARSLGACEATRAGRDARRGPWLAASPLLVIALVPLAANWRQASRAGETATAAFARDLLDSVEPYGVLVTMGDNDTFPLWYAQEVEGVRRDVTIAVTSLLNTDWYARQALVRRPVYEYDAARGPAVYRDRAWKKPAGPPLSLTVAQADAVPLFTPLPGPQRLTAGSLTAVIDPAQLPYGGLERADVFVLRMIKEGATTGRPVYVSTTTGDYAQRLGLGDYTLTQGMASKIVYEPVAPGADTAILPGLGAVDVPRSLALWNGYEAPAAIVRRGDWVDRASVGIPFVYVRSGAILAESLARTGRVSLAGAVLARADSVARAVRLDVALRLAEPAAAPTDAPARQPVPARP